MTGNKPNKDEQELNGNKHVTDRTPPDGASRAETVPPGAMEASAGRGDTEESLQGGSGRPGEPWWVRGLPDRPGQHCCIISQYSL